MAPKITIQKPYLLMVEGQDEQNFFEALLEQQSINAVQVLDFAGKDKLKDRLPMVVNTEGFGEVVALGIVRDAEQNRAISAFESVCFVLKQNNLPVPTALATVMSGKPKTSIFIMPDNDRAGMLESLCLQTLEGQPVANCIEQFIQCSQPKEQKEQEIFNIPKAKVQAYLAARAPIVNSLGLAARKGYWDFTNPAFNDIKKFLHDLFVR